MGKIITTFILFGILFLVPIKHLRDDVRYLEEDKFMLEMAIVDNEDKIDSLNNVIFKLNNDIKLLRLKPIKKKPFKKEIKKVIVPTIDEVPENNINDTLKI